MLTVKNKGCLKSNICFCDLNFILQTGKEEIAAVKPFHPKPEAPLMPEGTKVEENKENLEE